MVRERSLSKPKSDQATVEDPYNLFFPDEVKNQLSRIKKKDRVLFEHLENVLKKSARTESVVRFLVMIKPDTGKSMLRITALLFTGWIIRFVPSLSSKLAPTRRYWVDETAI